MSISTATRIVLKVGTSTLTFDNGKPNFSKIEGLIRLLSSLKNSGKEIVLVTSGAVSVGVSRMGLTERPHDIKGKQAAAAVGQCELMAIYACVPDYKEMATLRKIRDTAKLRRLRV